jgi:hypothetical protein
MQLILGQCTRSYDNSVTRNCHRIIQRIRSVFYSVTVGWFWIDRIYWTDTARMYILSFTVTHTHILVSTVTSSLSCLCSSFDG